MDIISLQVKGDEVVDKWYSEIKDHKFGEEPTGTILKSGMLMIYANDLHL